MQFRRTFFPRLWLLLLLWLSLACFSASVIAQTQNAANDQTANTKVDKADIPHEQIIQQHSTVLDEAEIALDDNTQLMDNEALNALAAKALNIGQFATTCISNNEAEQKRLEDALATLKGEKNKPASSPATDENSTPPTPNPHPKSKADDKGIIKDAEVKKAEQNLQEQLEQAQKRLSQCRLLNLRANDVQDTISTLKQEQLTRHLFAQTQSAWDYALQALSAPAVWATETKQIATTFASLPINLTHFNKALMYGVLGMVIGLFWSLYKHHQYSKQVENNQLELSSPTWASLWHSLISTMPFILLFGLMLISLYFYPLGVQAIYSLISTALVFTLSYAIISGMLQPKSTEAGKTDSSALIVNERASQKLFFWARIFLFTTLFASLFFSPLLDTDPASSLVGLIRIALGTVAGLALIRLVWLLRKYLKWVAQYHLYIPVALGIIVSITALWLGYINFYLFLFTGTFGTLFILLIGWILLRIPTEIFDGMDDGNADWQQRLRHRLGLNETQMVPGLIWLRLLNVLLVIIGVVVLLMHLWGVSWQEIYRMFNELQNGIEIGNFTFDPLRILAGLLVISLFIGFTHFTKSNLANSWLKRTNLSRGAKEATVTVSGYIGVTLAVLLGMSVAGIQLSSLALIAGALSVGIGFGLQNIVSNFISGLILLFERPIRRGDWIKVGSSEGYVREISIRSTIIQTFDRSDIIVPNSELISGQVTNMMLSNQYGRAIIPVVVAYDSDPDQVMQILRGVAERHPVVLREHGELKVEVLFMHFGEGVLKFELRCIIRDVEKVLGVESDLNVAVYKALTQANIEIPYPQQMIRLAPNTDGHIQIETAAR